ncbi:hypothetical protein CWB41_12320 [Methylovirgula ligni]|uniref:Uncharacterized protein DUF927 n=1 Tax=Methylovirgula ligni TaxID=569860 RepID=A0A3D9YTM5_9HYPH|nr:DUF927 domain-containing protein [Methylovirgula ligni]QAY96418.1 hypothetical protein CWB41_12320 [Methylovirgula ligni]REF85855.1 uncharacterized protein DUF927 [Methylovirgula ligni]
MEKTRKSARTEHHSQRGHSRAKGARVPQEPLSPFVRKIANLEHEETGDGFDVFQFVKVNGRDGECAVPREDALDSKKVKSHLEKKNAHLPNSSEDALSLIAAAIQRPPTEFQLQAATAGWRREERAFICLDRVIKFGTAPIAVCPPAKSRERFSSRSLGTLESWQQDVADVAQFSTVATLMMSAAFAAPLLSMLNFSPFIFNLYGASKSGKTTAILLAAAITGLAEENALPNWNSTDSGLLQLFRAFNDSVVPVNELGLLRGKKADRSERVREMIYAFGEGRDRLRHSESSFGTQGKSSTFRGILLSTSETSFRELRGADRDDGELARAHDIPALMNGSKTIFDRLPANQSASKSRAKLNEFRQAITQNSAVAFDKYIKWLAKNEDAEDKAYAYIDDLMGGLHLPTGDGALQHAARNFAVCFAGAALAIESEVLPWKVDSTRSVIVEAFEQFRKVNGRPLDARRKAKSVLKSKLKELDLPTVSKIKKRPDDGVILKAGLQRRYVIPSSRFDELFETELLAREALMALEEVGHLEKTKGAGPATTANKKWAEIYVKLPDGTNFRAIKFKPFAKKKKKTLPSTVS